MNPIAIPGAEIYYDKPFLDSVEAAKKEIRVSIQTHPIASAENPL
jgi:hypothetical protein